MVLALWEGKHSMKHFKIFRFGLACVAVLLGVLLLGSVAGRSTGQTVSWGQAIPLSANGSFSWFPDITADRSGRVHVAWSSGVVGFDAVVYASSVNGEVWTPANDIAAIAQDSGSAATRPAMLVDPRGYLHLTFVDTKTLYYTRAPIWSAGSAAAWADRQVLSGQQVAYFSRMAMDSKGVIHLVYTENASSVACMGCYHLYYRQSADAGVTWSPAVDISLEQEGVAKPTLLVDSKDQLHVVWEGGLGGGLGQLPDPTTVKYAASYDGGVTWTKATAFSVIENPNLKNITLGIDREKRLVAVFWALPYDWLMYSTSEDAGRTWSAPAQIPGVWGAAAVYKSNLDTYSMASDSAGNLHLVFVGRKTIDSKTVDVLDVVWDGETWSSPTTIAEYEKDVPEWPRVAISQGNQINVVWFVRDEAHIWESDKGRYRVWYARGVSAAASEPPQTIPTFTPAPTPTLEISLPAASPGVTPTEVSFPLNPTLRATESAPGGNVLYSEQDYLGVVGKAVVPSVLFLAGVVLIAFLRRR
jgi:hypothetical protein